MAVLLVTLDMELQPAAAWLGKPAAAKGSEQCCQEHLADVNHMLPPCNVQKLVGIRQPTQPCMVKFSQRQSPLK